MADLQGTVIQKQGTLICHMLFSLVGFYFGNSPQVLGIYQEFSFIELFPLLLNHWRVMVTQKPSPINQTLEKRRKSSYSV